MEDKNKKTLETISILIRRAKDELAEKNHPIQSYKILEEIETYINWRQNETK